LKNRYFHAHVPVAADRRANARQALRVSESRSAGRNRNSALTRAHLRRRRRSSYTITRTESSRFAMTKRINMADCRNGCRVGVSASALARR
jgi:hypothetical protein